MTLAELQAAYFAVAFPWHERGVGCDDLPDHRHGNRRIIFYPDAVSVERPEQEPT